MRTTPLPAPVLLFPHAAAPVLLFPQADSTCVAVPLCSSTCVAVPSCSQHLCYCSLMQQHLCVVPSCSHRLCSCSVMQSAPALLFCHAVSNIGRRAVEDATYLHATDVAAAGFFFSFIRRYMSIVVIVLRLIKIKSIPGERKKQVPFSMAIKNVQLMREYCPQY